MKKELKLILSVMASLIIAAAVCALPVTLPNTTLTHEQTAAAQSVSGKIASVEKTSFTLTVEPGHAMTKSGQQFQDSAMKSMTFQIDKNTTIDGKLKVGATADVTYREESGNLVAISVRVS
jgi:predicted 3-demethylubiquinone-9 3-methyltransferase (glyoxalase superfamily)